MKTEKGNITRQLKKIMSLADAYASESAEDFNNKQKVAEARKALLVEVKRIVSTAQQVRSEG